MNDHEGTERERTWAEIEAKLDRMPTRDQVTWMYAACAGVAALLSLAALAYVLIWGQ